MRILVTGASGFIGRNALLAMPPDWEVIALHRPTSMDFLRFIRMPRLAHVQPIACDLTDEQQVRRMLDRVGRNFQGCLALASNTSIPGSIAQPAQDLITNTVGLLNLLQNASFEHLVYFSSGAVYVGLHGPVGPTSPIAPTLPYAISKFAAEQYIRAYALHHSNPHAATILRFFGAYGPYEPARKLYTKLVQQFAFEKNPDFTITGDGENYIDAMYVDDTVKALMAVLTQTAPVGVACFDLGVGGRESVNQVVTRAAQTFGLEPRLHHEGATAEYIRFTIDPHIFAEKYKFVPTIPLEVGLQHLATHLARRQEDASLATNRSRTSERQA